MLAERSAVGVEDVVVGSRIVTASASASRISPNPGSPPRSCASSSCSSWLRSDMSWIQAWNTGSSGPPTTVIDTSTGNLGAVAAQRLDDEPTPGRPSARTAARRSPARCRSR